MEATIWGLGFGLEFKVQTFTDGGLGFRAGGRRAWP